MQTQLSSITMAENFDLRQLDPSFYANPYPYYHALRQHCPIKKMADGSLLLTRYHDLKTVYKDTQSFSSDKKQEFAPKFGTTPLFEHHTTSLVFNDAPYHTRVRRLIAGALMPRYINALAPSLHALVDHLLDDMAQTVGPVDLITAFAGAIPVEIIGNLLGVPSGDRHDFRQWSLAVLGALEPVLDSQQMADGNRAVVDMSGYLRQLIRQRRRQPCDPERDLLTRLILGEQGETLSESELIHNAIFLLNAGHETTTNLIGNALYLLHEWPSQLAQLLANPTLIHGAIEESLRFESPNQLGNRLTVKAARLDDRRIVPGTPITLCIGAANRDPEQFPESDVFRISRHPNRHLAFGSGIHQCVGMGLGRLEGQIAVAKFVHRFPKYRLIADKSRRGRRARFRGFLSLGAQLTD